MWDVTKKGEDRKWEEIDIKSENTQALSKQMKDTNPQMQFTQHSLSKVYAQEAIRSYTMGEKPK